MWPVGRADFTKDLTGRGGPGFESHRLHIILNQYNDAMW
jgi:hypothetical protein